jgi:hypothetical protein
MIKKKNKKRRRKYITMISKDMSYDVLDDMDKPMWEVK